ncbi:hypothetical protein [Ferrimonas sp. YFM]|uniref:hypothetical protein n=1 Tax=Ferrimonas sp. YFM TaxID=3028878 RepID=UPI002574022A|nr:hypothetical protein [Ferrimonas sp. YFM]BDY05412.1 hypothetical protein F0521_24530 [Ferrimonas sp. YFM]
MLQRWSWLNLDKALAHKPARVGVLYRHFIPIYLHYQGQYLKATWEGDLKSREERAKVVQSVVQAFIDTHQAHELTLDEAVLNQYDIELEWVCPGDLESQSYEAARGIFEDCLQGQDPQKQLLSQEQSWIQLLQHRATEVGRRFFSN